MTAKDLMELGCVVVSASLRGRVRVELAVFIPREDLVERAVGDTTSGETTRRALTFRRGT
jgi:hypothetical protein